MSIFASLALPVNAVIRVTLYRPLVNRAARKLEEQEACQEVMRAVQAWHYETYC